MFDVSFDPQSLKEIAQFYGFSVFLSEEMGQAMQQAGDLLVSEVKAAMHWKNPTGQLEDSITLILSSRFELQVGSDDPKARRRDRGFSGMTDSLGRFYANDPGAFFMEQGIEASRTDILNLFDDAAERALARLQGGS